MNINKKLILLSFIAVIVLSVNSSFPQQIDGGAFGAPVVKFSSIAGQNAIQAGGKFGWVIDSSIVLGGGLYALVNGIKTGIVDPVSGQNVLLGFNCGGIELEYIIYPGNNIHASVGMFIAGAGTTYGVSDKSVSHSSYFSQNLLLWEPQVNIEFNIVNWFHLDIGISYRYCVQPGTENFYNVGKISLASLSGLSVLFTFKVGSY
jgi:hypothetical protein